MKQFTPTDMHHNPAQVYRDAERQGRVEINHSRYPDVTFVLTAVPVTPKGSARGRLVSGQEQQESMGRIFSDE